MVSLLAPIIRVISADIRVIGVKKQFTFQHPISNIYFSSLAQPLHPTLTSAGSAYKRVRGFERDSVA